MRLRGVLLLLLLLLVPLAGACGDEDEDAGGGDSTEQSQDAGADAHGGEGGDDSMGDDDVLSDGDVRNPDNYAVYERLSVEPGGENVVREGNVVRAEKRDAYVVSVSEFGTGQALNVRISSLEDNASVHVYGPDDAALAEDVMDISIPLEAGGDYVIEVGPTRGNTTYTLTVNVSVDAG